MKKGPYLAYRTKGVTASGRVVCMETARLQEQIMSKEEEFIKKIYQDEFGPISWGERIEVELYQEEPRK